MKATLRKIDIPGLEKFRGRIFNDPRLKDIKDLIEKHGDATKKFSDIAKQDINSLKEENATLLDRIEELETRATSPGKTAGSRQAENLPYRTYESASGKIFELPSNVKMADAIPPKQKPPVSFERWVSAFAAGSSCKDREALEYFQSIRAAIETGSTGVLIPQEYISQWIDLIRSQMVLNSAGLTTVTMLDKIQNSSAVATDPTASWHSESGAITANNPTFAARTLTAQTLVTRCQGSLEVTQDSPDFGRQLAQVMAKSMSVELDRVGLIGSGTPPEPQGILGATGINQVTGVGSVADYAEILSGVRKLLDSNLTLEQAASVAIMSPGVWLAYENLATGISGDKTQLMRPKSLENTRFLVTTNGLDTGSPLTSTVFMGNFQDLVLGIRREASIESLKLTTFASNLLIEFVGYLRADYMIRRPASFVTLEGVTPA